MKRKYFLANPKRKPILPKIANIVGIISGALSVFQLVIAFAWKIPSASLEHFSRTNSFYAVLLLSSLVLWLFCFSTLFNLSNKYHSKYFNDNYIFNRYRKFRTLSVITSIVMGIILIALEAIMADFLIPKAISTVLSCSIAFWIITVIIWYRGFIWYSRNKSIKQRPY